MMKQATLKSTAISPIIQPIPRFPNKTENHTVDEILRSFESTFMSEEEADKKIEDFSKSVSDPDLRPISPQRYITIITIKIKAEKPADVSDAAVRTAVVCRRRAGKNQTEIQPAVPIWIL